MCDSMHETAATPSVSLATIVSMCVCIFKNYRYVFRQAKVYRALATIVSMCVCVFKNYRYVFRQAEVYRALAVYVPYTKTKTIFPH